MSRLPIMKKHPRIKFKYLGLLLLTFRLNQVWAEGLTLDIVDSVDSTIPMAIVPFVWQGADLKSPIDAARIVKSDLTRTGYFTLLAEQNMLTKPAQMAAVKFRDWQVLGQEYMVIGRINESQRLYSIQVELLDVFKEEQIFSYQINATAAQLRQAMHRISDLVFEHVTGITGTFSSKIAYITRSQVTPKESLYRLLIADIDGYNPITIVASNEPLMSPTWSPDSKKIAYVSFEDKASSIFVQTLVTGERVKISSHPGINGAPAWSPDGKRMAITLSKDGNPDIFIINLVNRSLLKLTQNLAIDTEPTWSPDGKLIIFTSDRGGKPQLYQIPSSGGHAQRLTFQGSYNARGSFSRDGKKLVMVHGNNGDYRIAVMNLSNKTVSILTTGKMDEAPSFSPNGSLLIYAAQQGGQRVLSSISIKGGARRKIGIEGQVEIREAVWSP